jgi:DNA-binding MarR family transcriptional regulator
MPGQTMNQAGGEPRPIFTPLQGQYLAFIHAYTLVNGRPPAEHEMMRFFQVTPPTVHRMVVTLEEAGWISRQPGRPGSTTVLLHENDLPRLKPGFGQTVKTTVTGY